MTAAKTMSLEEIRNRGDSAKPHEDEALTPRDLEFIIKYTDPNGRSHEGVCRSSVMSNDKRLEVARIAARLAGVPWDRLPTVQAARIWALATVSQQLQEPLSWLEKWIVEDDDLLFQVYNVLLEHDRKFFRPGGTASGTGAEASRVSITPTHVAASTTK